MGRSQESFNKKEVRSKKEKKRKEKAEKRAARREGEKKSSLDDMIAYVDANGNIVSTPPPEPTPNDEIKLEDIEVSVPKGGSAADEDPIKKGIVTIFNDSKGFGFIKNSDTKQDVFVHINNIVDEIKEGNKVTYEEEMGQRGPTAVNVKLDK
jgi:cold shock CspA family protein